MLNAKAFANAASSVMAIWVVACAMLSYIAPDLLFNIAQSWMHTINLESVKTAFTPSLGSIVWGLVSAVGLTWVTTYGMITLYNRWAK
ncbi:hypothetical protein A3B45_04755 [Candidatus Daviesbacteria bacterium RIFCSPLOWO2_01_FULL_39_12]|uniref:DUF2062 domain-containing protein n=1 Tax=Candidatus Daviesbacteria bacterium RIFCSPLOWO2_01_FULL_39_12 TaxID=1797785 RepID=A0A1F5KLA3_9BACT|nr:MAG: hypothetical protein A3D79_01180 [Candidatus Daviesbacteria bacterium RIFCSPHIGHO2_02_FULL_39_8]OGE41717.1 MAG: hypothetical protein A3B45_04755 [Candidatus Daviesbacteria bacterium RIFCSPLOWO2_01_FULL_39_12]